MSVALVDLGDGSHILTVPCPICGVLLSPSDCIEVTSLGDARPRYVPMRCTTPRCGEVCKTCRRDIGDVHGPHCWVHMRDKTDRPHIVDVEDCR